MWLYELRQLANIQEGYKKIKQLFYSVGFPSEICYRPKYSHTGNTVKLSAFNL